jgi:glycosyltransferase involved in cell wall biosynthesis
MQAEPLFQSPLTGPPLHVMQIASGDLWAGAEKQLYVLATALQRQGVEVSAAIMNPGPLAERLAAAGIPTRVFDESCQGSAEIFAGLRRYLREVRPDVVHTHRTKENILGGLAAASLDIPSIRTQHGAQEHPASLLDLRRQVLTRADWLAGRFLQQRIVAVSAILEADLKQTLGAARVVQIPNGLNLGEAPPDRNWAANRTWTIGIVGRQVRVKRVDIFLETISELERLLPNQAFHVQVIGDGPLRAEHEALARRLNLRSEVIFTGHVDNAEVAIAALDILVICSDHEGLPMVALEAMRAGTVILTHAIGALPELLDSPRGALFAPAQTASAFAATLASALSQAALLADLSNHARLQLERRYSDASMADAYTEVYRAAARVSK